jgi:hypothetical protein
MCAFVNASPQLVRKPSYIHATLFEVVRITIVHALAQASRHKQSGINSHASAAITDLSKLWRADRGN